MLNRRHIRTIVVQTIYSNYIELIDKKNYSKIVKENAIISLELFLNIIDYLKEIHLYFNNLESQKYSCPYISNNPYFFFFSKINTESIKRNNKINWDLHHNYIIEIQNQIFELNNEYIARKEKADKLYFEFFIKTYSDIIVTSEILHDFLEEQNINWVNDFPYVNSYLIKEINSIDIQSPSSFSFPTPNVFEEEIRFGQLLLNSVLDNYTELLTNLDGRTPNWDSDRIALIDKLIMVIAIAELIYFPLIPTKVTINEYIEIAKEFSTPSSGKFINGILDNIVKDLTKSGLIVKKGRGLIT